jgi:uncharacterized membrane protein
MSLVARLWRNNITTTFLAGLVVLLPVVLTVLIIAWIIDVLRAALAPDILPRILKKTKDPERALKVPTLEPAGPQFIPRNDAAE